MEREVRRNVEVNPKKPIDVQDDRVQDSIRRAERYGLDGWTSTKFQATGVALALALAVAMLAQGPP